MEVDNLIYSIPDKRRQMLIDSKQDILNKNLISNKEVNEEEEQWLKE